MKRSEAVKKLTSIYRNLFTSEMLELYTDEELCESMLTQIEEEIRMKPPHVTIPGVWHTPNDNCVWEDE